MDLGEMIQECVEDSSRWFPDVQASPDFKVLAAFGELGEIANIIKKVLRGSITWEEALDPRGKYNLPEEIVDALIYICMLMGDQVFEQVDWEKVWREKRLFNESRFGKVL